MKIQKMKMKDISRLLELWGKANLSIENPKKEILEAKKMLLLNPSSCFVVVDGEEIIGSIFGIFNGRRAWIHHLAVHEKWQKRGIGKALLLKAEKAFKKLEATRINLWVDLQNLKVAPFYEKCGYQACESNSV
ncbi:GNAT family N-acetyltransferase, partial [Candidatus Roizmanbacteria bacterium]|nr:GNAT family N-acetyltransferase [Candidatus Roizmanbacteria bacterium]